MNSKTRQQLIVIVIAVLILIIMGGYLLFIYWGISQSHEIPIGIRFTILGILSLIFIPIMILMIGVAYKRNKEIDEEDEDDLGQY